MSAGELREKEKELEAKNIVLVDCFLQEHFIAQRSVSQGTLIAQVRDLYEDSAAKKHFGFKPLTRGSYFLLLTRDYFLPYGLSG